MDELCETVDGLPPGRIVEMLRPPCEEGDESLQVHLLDLSSEFEPCQAIAQGCRDGMAILLGSEETEDAAPLRPRLPGVVREWDLNVVGMVGYISN